MNEYKNNLSELAKNETNSEFFEIVVKVVALLKTEDYHLSGTGGFSNYKSPDSISINLTYMSQ